MKMLYCCWVKKTDIGTAVRTKWDKVHNFCQQVGLGIEIWRFPSIGKWMDYNGKSYIKMEDL
jgi:hypothetical protein